MAKLDAAQRARREELLAQREAMNSWRDRLLSRRRKHLEARRTWLLHLLER